MASVTIDDIQRRLVKFAKGAITGHDVAEWACTIELEGQPYFLDAPLTNAAAHLFLSELCEAGPNRDYYYDAQAFRDLVDEILVAIDGNRPFQRRMQFAALGGSCSIQPTDTITVKHILCQQCGLKVVDPEGYYNFSFTVSILGDKLDITDVAYTRMK